MKTLASFLIFFVLGTMGVSLFYMSTDMNMAENMSDCPLMTRGESLCPMDLIDHIAAWQQIFQAVTPTLTLLMLAVVAVILVSTIAPHKLIPKLRPPRICLSYSPPNTYTYWLRPFQELFASGILHPKLF